MTGQRTLVERARAADHVGRCNAEPAMWHGQCDGCDQRGMIHELVDAIGQSEAELNHWRDEAGNMHDMISRAERAEARVAELERELFGYRHMAARYEEADVLHARLRKERYNLQGRIAELEKTAYADVVEAVRKHHIAFHVELTRDGWIPRGFAECKDDRCASLARLDAPAKDRP